MSLQTEKVQGRATQITSDLENTAYEERLNELGSLAKGKEDRRSKEELLCPYIHIRLLYEGKE